MIPYTHTHTNLLKLINKFSKVLGYKPAFKNKLCGFPDGAVVENLPANAGDTGSSPGLGGSHMPWSN